MSSSKDVPVFYSINHEKSYYLDEIASLHSKGIKYPVRVDFTSSIDEVKACYKAMSLKNDELRYKKMLDDIEDLNHQAIDYLVEKHADLLPPITLAIGGSRHRTFNATPHFVELMSEIAHGIVKLKHKELRESKPTYATSTSEPEIK